LLADIESLGFLLQEGKIEKRVTRIGAEQEFLVPILHPNSHFLIWKII
jgi:hypothetical protein